MVNGQRGARSQVTTKSGPESTASRCLAGSPRHFKGLDKTPGGLVSPTRCAAAQAGRAASRPAAPGCGAPLLGQGVPGSSWALRTGAFWLPNSCDPCGPRQAHLFTVRGQCPSGSIARPHALRPPPPGRLGLRASRHTHHHVRPQKHSRPVCPRSLCTPRNAQAHPVIEKKLSPGTPVQQIG